MTDYEKMGSRIRRKRQELGLTQQEFAARINVSTSFYGHIERGTRVPSVDTLVLIANALHTGIDVLLRDSLNIPVRVERNPLFSSEALRIVRTYLEEQQNALTHWLDNENEEDDNLIDKFYDQADTDAPVLPAVFEGQV